MKYYTINVKLTSGTELSVKVSSDKQVEVTAWLDSLDSVAEHTIVSSVNPRPHTKRKNGISDARIAKGWTQQELADAVGVAQQHIQRWESGKYTPKTAILMRIGEALGVDWSTLV